MRVNDGTSDKEIKRAMSTYLNRSGAGDYNLPGMTGVNLAQSNKKTAPGWNLRSRTKLAWYPGRDVDFKGTYAPPATAYSP